MYFSYEIIKHAYKTGLTPLTQGWWGGGGKCFAHAKFIGEKNKKRGEEKEREREKEKIKITRPYCLFYSRK